MKWKLPPQIKIYEALGAVGDGRIEISGTGAKVYSSSRQKFYEVKYDPEANAIMANDNGSYWQGYLGYPAIACLMKEGVITFDSKWAEALKGIAWKDINVKLGNDFKKTTDWIHQHILEKGLAVDELKKEIDNIEKQIQALNLSFLGKKVKPPTGY